MELKDKGRWAVATQKHLVGKRIDAIGLFQKNNHPKMPMIEIIV